MATLSAVAMMDAENPWSVLALWETVATHPTRGTPGRSVSSPHVVGSIVGIDDAADALALSFTDVIAASMRKCVLPFKSKKKRRESSAPKKTEVGEGEFVRFG